MPQGRWAKMGEESRENHRRWSRESVARKVAEKREYATSVKLESGCVDCPDDTPFPPHVLDFDHVRGEKIGNIGRMVGDSSPYQRLVDEIDKCEVVCANHHRIRTWGE